MTGFARTLVLAAGLAVPALAASAADHDPTLVASWDYIYAMTDGHNAGAEGALNLKADGTFADTRRIPGPRTTFGADTEGGWSTSGAMLSMSDAAGKPILSYEYVVGTTDRNGKRIIALTLKGDGLSYLLARRER